MAEVKRFSFSGEMYRTKDKLVYVDFPYDAVTEFGTAGRPRYPRYPHQPPLLPAPSDEDREK